jgi:proteasome accessory factor A
MQWEFLRAGRKYAEERGLEHCGGDELGTMVLDRWESVLGALESDPDRLDGVLDWVTKRNLIAAYADRNDLAWDDAKLQLLDIQYHDVRRERSLYERLVAAGKVERLLDDAEVDEATITPPATTRAYFRGMVLSRWADSVVAANWDSVILDVGTDPLRRIPMMEPTRGSKMHTEALFAECTTPRQLVERLST